MKRTHWQQFNAYDQVSNTNGWDTVLILLVVLLFLWGWLRG